MTTKLEKEKKLLMTGVIIINCWSFLALTQTLVWKRRIHYWV